MKPNKIKPASGQILILILWLAGNLLLAKPPVHKPTFVLVPGAWHGGWSWQKVRTILESNGNVVYTPTLSGLGEHKNTMTNKIDLNTHITDVVNLIVFEDLHDVVLVGHSYAGTVIAGVADQIPARLSQLVFLDAMIVENGQSPMSVHPRDAQAFLKSIADKNDDVVPSPMAAKDFGITDLQDAKWVNERLTPQPFHTFDQVLALRHPFGNGVPLTYITCTKPQLEVLKVFSEKARKNKDWANYELETGHDAMLTKPAELASLLESINKKGGRNGR